VIRATSLLVCCLIACAAQSQELPAPPQQNRDQQANQQQAANKNEYKYWNTSLKLRDVNLRQLAITLRALGFDLPVRLQGTASLDMTVGVPVNGVANLDAYQFHARLTTKNLQIENIALPEASGVLTFSDGRWVLSELRGRTSAGRFVGKATLDADPAQAFSVTLLADDVPAVDLLGAYVKSPQRLFNGKLDLRAEITGQLTPPGRDSPLVNANIEVASPGMTLAGLDVGVVEHRLVLKDGSFSFTPLAEPVKLDQVVIQQFRGEYKITSEAIVIDDISAQLYGGQVTATAELPRGSQGRYRVDARWDQLAPRIKLPPELSPDGLVLSGQTSGQIRWSAPADRLDQPAYHEANAELTVEPLTLSGDEMGALSVELSVAETEFQVRADGEVFSGEVEFESAGTLDPELQWTDIPQRMLGGRLIFRELALERAARLLSIPESRRYAGRISGEASLSGPAGESWQWQASLELRDVTIDQTLLSRRLAARIHSQDDSIHVESLRGDYAGGSLQADGNWALSRGPRTINFRLTRAAGSRLLLPLSAAANEWLTGHVSGRGVIVGRGPEFFSGARVVGSVRIRDGKVFEVPVGTAHSPLRAELTTAPLRWSVQFPRIRAAAARGAIAGNLELSSSAASQAGFNLDSRLRIRHVDFERVLKSYADTNTIGRGDLTGDVQLSGRNVETIDDLEGRFSVQLGGSDASAIPGLSAAGSALGALSLTGVRFTSGQARGRISRGAVQFQHTALSSDRVYVEGSGRVGIVDGRMDIRAMIATGSFEGQNLIADRVTSFALDSAIPFSSINRLLSNRTLVFDVVGTLSDPQIRVLSAETIQANLRRLLVREGAALILTGSVLGD